MPVGTPACAMLVRCCPSAGTSQCSGLHFSDHCWAAVHLLVSGHLEVFLCKTPLKVLAYFCLLGSLAFMILCRNALLILDRSPL